MARDAVRGTLQRYRTRQWAGPFRSPGGVHGVRRDRTRGVYRLGISLAVELSPGGCGRPSLRGARGRTYSARFGSS